MIMNETKQIVCIIDYYLQLAEIGGKKFAYNETLIFLNNAGRFSLSEKNKEIVIDIIRRITNLKELVPALNL